MSLYLQAIFSLSPVDICLSFILFPRISSMSIQRFSMNSLRCSSSSGSLLYFLPPRTSCLSNLLFVCFLDDLRASFSLFFFSSSLSFSLSVFISRTRAILGVQAERLLRRRLKVAAGREARTEEAQLDRRMR